MTTPAKRPARRPALPPGEKMEVVSIRLTPAMREKLRRIGQQALRQWLAAHPVTLAEVADGCLDAPEFLPAGGFVASACIIGRITTDCVDR